MRPNKYAAADKYHRQTQFLAARHPAEPFKINMRIGLTVKLHKKAKAAVQQDKQGTHGATGAGFGGVPNK